MILVIVIQNIIINCIELSLLYYYKQVIKMSSNNDNKIISVTPSDALVFRLKRDSESKVTLRITNTSLDSCIAYKIKTTQPTWYIVKPSQHVIDVGNYKDIEISIVENESNRFLDQALTNTYEKLDKHRFLVQSRTISNEEYEKISTASEQQRLNEFVSLWDSTLNEPYKLKLKVEFVYPESSTSSNSNTQRQQAQIISKNAQIIEERLLKKKSAMIDGKADDLPTSEATTTAELVSLRRKFDSVVEYTVQLTAERDILVTQLEEKKRELARKKGAENSSSKEKNEKKVEKNGNKKKNGPTISLLHMFVVAITMWFIGRFMRS